MKKLFKYLLLLIPVSVIIAIFGACGGHEEPQPQYWSLKYEAAIGGSILGEAEQTIIESGNGASVTAVANEGYAFIKWSDGQTDATRTDLHVRENIVVTAIFNKLSFNVVYTVGGNGTLEGEQRQTIGFGENAETVTAIPDEGYQFVKWSDTNSTNPIRTDLNIKGDIEATAVFEKITYSVQYHVNEGGTIYGEEVQSIAYGESAETVIAIPNDGYLFVKWSDGVTDSVRRDIGVTSEINVTAEFEFLFAGGEGKRFNAFLIETYTQLLNISYYPKSYYKLANDLDLTGIKHEPIFDTSTTGFSGSFDGNGKTIRNLTVESDKNLPSLFGLVNGGFVENLNLTDVAITTVNYNTEEAGEQYCVGAVAGIARGLLNNITVSGTILTNGFDYDYVAIGGLAGVAYGTVADCTANMQIEIDGAKSNNSVGEYLFYFGGMIGSCRSANIDNCSVEGNITITDSCSQIIVGGLSGYYICESKNEAYVKNSEARVEITCDTFCHAGGFLGRIEVVSAATLQITNCASHGNMENVSGGGFIYKAFSSGNLTFDCCYADNNIKGSKASGFAVNLSCASLDTASCNVSNCSATGNMSSVNSEDVPVGFASGFVYQSMYTEFTNCYATGNVTARFASGFAFTINRSVLSACFASGTIYFQERVGGFAHSIAYSELINCFSNSNLVCTRQKEGDSLPVSLGGFVYSLAHSSKLANCYYSGKISAESSNIAYFTDKVGAFVWNVSESDIINCHVLKQNPMITNAVGQIKNEADLQVEVTEYETIEEMYFLADELNKDLEDEVWVNVENACPQLKFLG